MQKGGVPRLLMRYKRESGWIPCERPALNRPTGACDIAATNRKSSSGKSASSTYPNTDSAKLLGLGQK